MDPNEALRALRETTHELAKQVGIRDDDPLDVLGYMMVERFRALDEWLSKGGFLPAAWQRGHHLTRAEIVDGTGFAPGQTFTLDPLGPPNPAHGELPEHAARPDDDPEPGDRCKDCGQRITWVGPSHLDWAHVPRDLDELIASDTQGLLD